MKISELEQELGRQKEKFGDIPIKVGSCDCPLSSDFDVYYMNDGTPEEPKFKVVIESF